MYQLAAMTLYLGSVFVDDMSLGNPDVIDRRDRGLQRPWGSEGRHVYILNKPEQLRGPLSPHRKAGTQKREAWAYLQPVSARVLHGTRRYLCVLDIQDSCCPLQTCPGPLVRASTYTSSIDPPCLTGPDGQPSLGSFLCGVQRVGAGKVDCS